MRKYRYLLGMLILPTIGMTWFFLDWAVFFLAAFLPLAASLTVLVTCAIGLLRPHPRQRGVLLASLCTTVVFQVLSLVLAYAGRGLPLPAEQLLQYRLRVALVVSCAAIYLVALYLVARSRRWLPMASST